MLAVSGRPRVGQVGPVPRAAPIGDTDVVIELGRGTLTCEQVALIARRGEPVRLAAGVAARLAAGHAAVLALAAAGPVYGRSTGVGALVRQRLDQPLDQPMDRPVPLRPGQPHDEPGYPAPSAGSPAEDEAGPGDPLLHSHATTAGPALPADQVRAMTAVRIEQLAAGRSGLGPATATALVDTLNADRLPTVGRFHSLGTGDVAPLARLGVGLPPGAMEPGDALALMSSNALSIGRAALSVVDLDTVLSAATVVTALTFLARDGSPGALHPLAAGPFAGPRWVAAELRRLGAGSRPPARLQDQYGLRTAPQTLGVAVDAGSALRDVVTALARAGLENPLVLTGPPAEVVHHGGFHALHLTAALDGASSGLARAAVGSVNRLALLTEPVLPTAGRETALEPQGPVASAVDAAPEPRLFLAGGPPAASGIMVLEYTAGAALGAVRAAAVPAAGQTVEASRGVEQDSTYAPLAADQLAEAIAATRVLVAVELVAAVRALRMRRGVPPVALEGVWQVCATLPGATEDRDLSEDVRLAEQLLDVLAPFVAGTGDDGEHPVQPEQPAEGP